jgi:hypothetical protein
MLKQPPVKIVREGNNMFVVANGVKIAKRGHKGTPQAKTWVPLEPGWVVLDSGDYDGIVVQYTPPGKPQ